jgi:hypothetical protein
MQRPRRRAATPRHLNPAWKTVASCYGRCECGLRSADAGCCERPGGSPTSAVVGATGKGDKPRSAVGNASSVHGSQLRVVHVTYSLGNGGCLAALTRGNYSEIV